MQSPKRCINVTSLEINIYTGLVQCTTPVVMPGALRNLGRHHTSIPRLLLSMNKVLNRGRALSLKCAAGNQALDEINAAKWRPSTTIGRLPLLQPNNIIDLHTDRSTRSLVAQQHPGTSQHAVAARSSSIAAGGLRRQQHAGMSYSSP